MVDFWVDLGVDFWGGFGVDFLIDGGVSKGGFGGGFLDGCLGEFQGGFSFVDFPYFRM